MAGDRWIVHFPAGWGAYGPFPTRREAIEWGESWSRVEQLRGSFMVAKLRPPHPTTDEMRKSDA